MTSFVFRREAIVEFGNCDPDETVHVPKFFQYFDTNTWMLFEAALGVATKDFKATFGIMPLVDVRVACHRPVRFGEIIEIASHVSEFRRSSFDVAHKITIDGDLAVEGGETRVWAVHDKNDPAKIIAQAVPQDVIARFK